MSRFETGDRVKVMTLTVEESDAQAILARGFVGHVGTVIGASSITSDDPYDVWVEFEDGRRLWFSHDELEAPGDH